MAWRLIETSNLRMHLPQCIEIWKKLVLTVVISSKMHCNAENACTNGKWQHAAQMKLYPLTLSTERDRERDCPKHTRLSTSYLNWHRCWVWRATALNTNKEKTKWAQLREKWKDPAFRRFCRKNGFNVAKRAEKDE